MFNCQVDSRATKQASLKSLLALPLPCAQGLPAAGCTVQRASQPSGDLSAPQQTWQTGTSSAFKLRGKNYMQDRKKFPSEEAMYVIWAALDILIPVDI
jgi:hypothetical protein